MALFRTTKNIPPDYIDEIKVTNNRLNLKDVIEPIPFLLFTMNNIKRLKYYIFGKDISFIKSILTNVYSYHRKTNYIFKFNDLITLYVHDIISNDLKQNLYQLNDIDAKLKLSLMYIHSKKEQIDIRDGFKAKYDEMNSQITYNILKYKNIITYNSRCENIDLYQYPLFSKLFFSKIRSFKRKCKNYRINSLIQSRNDQEENTIDKIYLDDIKDINLILLKKFMLNNFHDKDDSLDLDKAKSGYCDKAKSGYCDKAKSGYLDKAKSGYQDKAKSGYCDKAKSGYDNNNSDDCSNITTENCDKKGEEIDITAEYNYYKDILRTEQLNIYFDLNHDYKSINYDYNLKYDSNLVKSYFKLPKYDCSQNGKNQKIPHKQKLLNCKNLDINYHKHNHIFSNYNQYAIYNNLLSLYTDIIIMASYVFYETIERLDQ